MTVAQLQSIVSLLRSRPGPETPDIGYSRAAYEKLAVLLGGAPDAKCEKVDADGVPAEWVAAPGIDSQRAVLYLHGGGYAIGSINTHRRLAYDISAASSARVLLIDYRLAPEHPFPAAVDDAAKAWRWLLQQGFTSDRLAIAGDSAGGGLTIATLVNLRDRKLGLPACAVAISPWIDLEGQGASITTRAAQDPMVQKAGLLWMAGLYLAGKDPRTPLAAPLHADLTGLPPVLVQVGTAETLLDDATRLAEKLYRAGGDVRLAVWPDMLHVFPFFAPILSEGRDGCREIGQFIRDRMR
ncbi:MAG: alpha/beta hydrolase [Reyranella sp.]|jgi:acetyl esterase/lipase|uniref:alpha/beta hydrolase n=1 Tax=Reyranella sp. TaxID=1929291 RepID=UPI001AC24B3F|nr:alpha/beta hydrolase [Reyranella sp.]MBN9536789.1 alpha/beta hydrolase [Alphaproteobacteria bacterium]MBR2818646.1 alpha/beta hydrolase [Reyranella sp.]